MKTIEEEKNPPKKRTSHGLNSRRTRRNSQRRRFQDLLEGRPRDARGLVDTGPTGFFTDIIQAAPGPRDNMKEGLIEELRLCIVVGST